MRTSLKADKYRQSWTAYQCYDSADELFHAVTSHVFISNICTFNAISYVYVYLI